LSAPELAGRRADLALENLDEIRRIRESEPLGDHRDRQIGVREEALCLEIDARRDEPLRVDPGSLHRGARQALFRTSESRGVLSHAMPLRKSPLHETPEALEASRSDAVHMLRCFPFIMQHRKTQQQRAHLIVQQRMQLFPWRGALGILAHLRHALRHRAELVRL
jgi:hypothetical protein